MTSFSDYMIQIQKVKFSEINSSYKNQFKLKETMLNASNKNFDSIAQKFLEEENAGSKLKWDKPCKLFFVWFIIKFFQSKGKRLINPSSEEWSYFANVLKSDQEFLKGRWITLINLQNKSLSWNNQEDEIIKKLMTEKEQKHIWTQIAVELYNHNSGQFVRTPKQIRERWMNHLNPVLKKDDWTRDEDNLLMKLVVEFGKRWSHISLMIGGRTENQVKNKYKSLINKIFKDEDLEDVDEIEVIQEYLKNQNQTQDEVEQSDQKKNIELMKHEKIQKPPSNSVIRTNLTRQAKNKHKEHLQLQKEKDQILDNFLEYYQCNSNSQQFEPKVKIQDTYIQKKQRVENCQNANIITNQTSLVNSGFDQCIQETYMQSFFAQNQFNQYNLNDFNLINQLNFRPLAQISENKIEPYVNTISLQINNYKYKGFRPYQQQIERSPIQLMSETLQNIHQSDNSVQNMQKSQNNLSDYSKQCIVQKPSSTFPQVGSSPIQTIYSPYAQPNMFNNPLNYYLQHCSPQMLLYKSPSKPLNDNFNTSPYQQLFQDYQQPTPRNQEIVQTPCSVTSMLNHLQNIPQQLYPQQQYTQITHLNTISKNQESASSFDFLKDVNLISKWKTKQQLSTKAIQKEH